MRSMVGFQNGDEALKYFLPTAWSSQNIRVEGSIESAVGDELGYLPLEFYSKERMDPPH